jgi:pimeloyl-ACP methyl ester carboxylesterase
MRDCFVRAAAVLLLASVGLTVAVETGRSQGMAIGAAATPSGAQEDFAGLVDIGGRRLYLECRGTGSPTVVLEAGYRSPATVWGNALVQAEPPRVGVRDGVAAFTHVCLYERPGTAAVLDDGLHPSRSDPVPQPRTAEDVVADLHALLQTAGVPGPYVLVGHSLGGLFVRLYAATYPTEVVGLVLVDAWSERLQQLLTPEQWAAYVRLNLAIPPELAAYRDLETIDFAGASATMRQAAAAQPLPPLPLAVLAHGQPFGVPEADLGFSPEALEVAWRAAQDELATLVPRTRYTVASESGHYIQLQQPELVTEAVRQVVAGVQNRDTWDALVSCCLVD